MVLPLILTKLTKKAYESYQKVKNYHAQYNIALIYENGKEIEKI